MKENFTKIYKEYIKYSELKLKPQSIKKYENRYKNNILPYFGNKKIKEIDENFYIKWQIEIEKKGYSYRYKKTLHYALVEYYNYLIKFKKVKKNIPKIVGNFKNKDDLKKTMDFFSYDDYKLFIKEADNEVYKILFEFLFFTGCRLGESLALKYNDLNKNNIRINKTITKEFINGERKITTPKTEKSNRIIKIDDKLEKNLLKLKKKYFNEGKEENYFIFGGIKPLAPTTVERYKNKYCDKANIKHIRLHDFRHSHATLLLYNKIPIQEISNRLGHANISTTLDIYSHLMPDKEKRVINTLNSIRLN